MTLIVEIEHADKGADSAEILTFDKDKVTIGRSSSNDIVLSEPDVSGKHAILTHSPGSNGKSICVTDIGSANGTYVEDTQIEANVETPLADNQRVVISKFILRPQVAVDAEATGIFQKAAAQSAAAVAARQTESQGSKKTSTRQEQFAFKGRVHDILLQRLDLRRKDILAMDDEGLRTRTRATVEQILEELRWEIPSGLNRELLIKQMLDEALGLGPLEELIADETVSEIMVNSYDMIYAERAGKLGLTDLQFSSEKAVLGAIERIIAPIGRRVDESSPIVDARLKDGSRVNAVIRPLTLKGPCITIRKFSKDPLTIQDLVKFGSMSPGMAEFLELAVKNRMNVVISGGTGSGKTTLLNVVSSFIPEGERVITVEDAAELQLQRKHLIGFETRPPNLEGKGAITIRDLVKNALRMRPDRIVVGECRGAESLDMLQAMNTGHDGSMTTGHSNSPRDMVARLETMVLMAGMDLPVRAIREQIASAVNIVIQQTRFSCGSRKVTAITEVCGMDYDEGIVVLQDVFRFNQEGYDDKGKTRGTHQATGYVPQFFQKLQREGKEVNANVFSPDA
ncbi:MAG: Flp pilus assembly complex ATPase component TadA [Bdellovibrionales bacterium]|nr:Flp pilus assembly complex ATPase component TadA [Bdellovibrionales bacterium]